MKKTVLALLLALCLLLGAAPAALAAELSPAEQYESLYRLQKIILREGLESSPDDDPLGRALMSALEQDPQLFGRLMTAMLSGYDPYTRYVPAGQYSQAYGSADYVGIGVTITAHEQGALIADLDMDGPAIRAGLRIGDVITHVSGAGVAGKTLEDISALLRGDAGTAVRVSVLRGGETLRFSLVRRELQEVNYSGGHLADGIYYMKWSRIEGEDSYGQFRAGLQEMAQLGDTCLIMDLRDNPGGSLYMAYEIVADLMSEAVPFFRTAYRDPATAGRLISQTVVTDGEGVDIPHIWLLTNGSTASAAEIIAAGLRDTGRAVTVGGTTYGKARAQQHITMEDDSAIVLTTMELWSLKDGDYQDAGLQPDVPAENPIHEGQPVPRVPDRVALAAGSCSDNGLALNRALEALGALEELPEKPYQIGPETLEACRRLELRWLRERPAGSGVSVGTLQLVNHLLDLQELRAYQWDDQLTAALRLAKEALAADAAQ